MTKYNKKFKKLFQLNLYLKLTRNVNCNFKIKGFILQLYFLTYYPIKSILSISPFSLHNENSTDLPKKPREKVNSRTRVSGKSNLKSLSVHRVRVEDGRLTSEKTSTDMRMQREHIRIPESVLPSAIALSIYRETHKKNTPRNRGRCFSQSFVIFAKNSW